MGGPWLRWQATLGQDPKVVRAGPWGGLAYRAILELTKAQGWEGVIAKADVDGPVLARHLGWTGAEQVELHGELVTTAQALQAGLEACTAAGSGTPPAEALLWDDGDAWVLVRWRHYQLDPTAADRQRRHRQRQAAAKAMGGRGRRGRHRDGGSVTTVSHGDGRQHLHGEGPTAESKAAAPRHGDGPGKGGAAHRLELALDAGQREALQAAGLDLRARHGTAWAWEKAIRLLLADGITWEGIVAALLEEPVSAPPFMAFRRFDAALRGGRRPPAAPPRAGTGSRFAGVGHRDPVPAPGSPGREAGA